MVDIFPSPMLLAKLHLRSRDFSPSCIIYNNPIQLLPTDSTAQPCKYYLTS
jgi:hypothetical protein